MPFGFAFSNALGEMPPSDDEVVAPDVASEPDRPEVPSSPAAWRRLHPISPIVNSLDRARVAWPVLVIAVVRGPSFAIPALTIGASALIGWSLIVHLRFRYRLEGTVLTVESGVFVQRSRTLPADRVQQVTLNQKLRHQVFGVVEVGVESAGAGSEPEISLSVLAGPEANRVRAALSAARDVAGSTTDATASGAGLAPPVVTTELYRQPNGSLVRWAAANSPFLVLAVLGAVAGFAGDFGAGRLDRWMPSGGLVIGVSLAVIAVAALMVATVANVVRFYDMRLERVGDDLRLRYGLLTRHEADVPRERIHVLVENLSVPGRLAGVTGIRAHNASGSAGETTNYLPAVPRAASSTVTGLLAPGLDLHAPIERHPNAARRRAIIRATWPPLVGFLVLIAVTRSAWALVALLLVAIAPVLGWRSWTVLGHGGTPDVMVGRRGLWTEATSFVRRDRVQSAGVTASWFQRRRDLATLRIDVAQPLGSVVVRDMDADEAHRLLDELVA